VRKSDSDHATPTLFAMPVSCSVEPNPGICKKRGGDSPGGSLRERGDVSSKPTICAIVRRRRRLIGNRLFYQCYRAREKDVSRRTTLNDFNAHEIVLGTQTS
jgi:hypothetical protein